MTKEHQEAGRWSIGPKGENVFSAALLDGEWVTWLSEKECAAFAALLDRAETPTWPDEVHVLIPAGDDDPTVYLDGDEALAAFRAIHVPLTTLAVAKVRLPAGVVEPEAEPGEGGGRQGELCPDGEFCPHPRTDCEFVCQRGEGNEPAPVPVPEGAGTLPEGVHEAPDGTLLCQGINLPDGWTFYGPPESIGAADDESRPYWDWRDRDTDVRSGHAYYEVRPVTPPTEPVGADKAVGRKLEDGDEIVQVVRGKFTSAWYAQTASGEIAPFDASGCVTVLVEDGK